MNDYKSNKTEKSNLPLYLSIVLVVGLIACYFLIPSVQQFLDKAWGVLTSNDNQRIKQWVDGFRWYGPMVIILAMILQMFLLVIPTIALMVVSILAYGPIWGSLIILVSVFAASTVGYLIGRYPSQSFIIKLLGQRTKKKIENFIENYGFWAVIVTRLNPFLSNDAISFVGGILKMGYWRYIAATMVGIMPLTVLIAILGKSTDQLKSGLLWGSLASLILFGAYIFWDKSKSKNSAKIES
ncbi:TVP38/TMEM64 family protein [Gillisia sp. CAL575]|uniref:TVP38/TMEM64 family protein n=1 Tax=Gillisia sp. CAL575 TaxID=985255 RepID=UPI0003A5A27D|nr:TVP38/TMEM64 family protein [Gillisia sp. CAL575]